MKRPLYPIAIEKVTLVDDGLASIKIRPQPGTVAPFVQLTFAAEQRAATAEQRAAAKRRAAAAKSATPRRLPPAPGIDAA